jgi:hypothetical protein
MPNETKGPQLSIALPYAFVNQRLGAGLAGVAPATLAAPVPGLPKLSLAPKSLALQPARNDRAGFRLALGVRQGGDDLADVAVGVEVKPVVDAKRGKIALTIRPDDLRSVEPTLGAAAQKELGDALYGLLPGSAKMVVGKDGARDAATRLLREVTSKGWPVVRDHLLSDLGEVARFELSLDGLPLDHVALRDDPRAKALVVDVWTTLPGAGGLKAGDAAAPDKVRVRLSGATVAALANWALDNGRLPPRYDEKGKPQKDGDYLPAVLWRTGDDRPLALHVFATKGTCLHATIGASPKVALATGKDGKPQLTVGVADGKVESVDGPLLIEIGAWLMSLWQDSINVSQNVVAQTKLKLPGGDWRMGLTAAQLDGDNLVLDLDLVK